MSCKRNNLFQTNNYSIVSKYSAVRSGYFQDFILRRLIEDALRIESWRRTPLVNRGYAARLMAMDWVIKTSIQIEHVDCFIVLGAGYDTSSFRWLSKNNGCSWIEIDLPQVVEIKSKFINDNKILGLDDDLKQVDDGIFCSSSSRYSLISCDLNQTEELAKCLRKVLSSFGTRRRFSIINEVCFCYMELKDLLSVMKAVIQTIESMAFRIYYIGYEQVKPELFSPFSRIMIDHFKTLGYPLKHYSSSLELKEFFCKSLGFTNGPNVSNMFQIYHNVLLEDKLETAAFRDEPFDEYEEMDLYLGHYALVQGLLILNDPVLPSWSHHQGGQLEGAKDEVSLCERLRGIRGETKVSRSFLKSPIRRYGHACCLLDESIIISGGFGILEPNQQSISQHKRLHDCSVLRKVENIFESYSLNLDDLRSTITLDRMHGQIARLSQNMLFFNGGRQSPLKQKPTNVNFIAALEDGETLNVRHKFGLSVSESTSRWRHKLTPVIDDNCWQFGGIGSDIDCSVFLWNLSSDKLGLVESRVVEVLDRHSFGMDMRDNYVALFYGGLKTDPWLRDYPVNEDISALLYDSRTAKPHEVHLMNYEPSYGASVHFITDTSFIRIGGISTKTGLLYNGLELVDLRNESAVQLLDNIVDELILDVPFLLTSSTVCHLKEDKTILTLGGGGNYFTFGTHLNQHHLFVDYSQI